MAHTDKAGEQHDTPDHVGEFPASRDDLHRWLVSRLGITVAERPMIAGHRAPFDYVTHVFFEGGRLLADAPGAPLDRARCDTARPTRTGLRPVAPDAHPGTDPALDCVVWANRGGGKTFLGAVATMLDLVFKPGVEVRILGGSLEQSKRMLAHLRALFHRPALESMLDGRITERRVRLRNGSVAEILAQSETSVRGTRVQKLRCDEVELFDPEVWEAAQLATRSADITLADGRTVEVRGSIECLSTMHRPYGLMHRAVRDAREGLRSLFRWGVVDVLDRCEPERPCGDCVLQPECQGRAKDERPAGHIRIDDAARMKRRVGAATWQSEMLCRRPRRSDSVFPEFDRAVHVVGEGAWAPPRGRVLAGMDFGFRAPTVVLWAVHDEHGVVWVLAERVKAETVLDEHTRAILDGPGVDGLAGPPVWLGVDPAGRQRNDQTGISASAALRKAGLTVRDKGLGQQEGLSLVRARLRPAVGGAARLFVHARCEHLIECLERYHYPADRPESMAPEKDGFDHAADALRYLVQNLDHRFETAHSYYT